MAALQTMPTCCGTQITNVVTQSGGDQLAAVVSKYSSALHRIALRKLGNVEDAEDAVQEAFLSAFKNMHQFRGQAQLSSWVGSIVVNSARMQLRRRLNKTAVSLDQTDPEGRPVWANRLEDSGPDPEEIFRRSQTLETLRKAAEKLPARLRVAFRMRVFDGLSTSEAAAALGIAEGTLKARFFRARANVTARVRRARKSARLAKAQEVRIFVDRAAGAAADPSANSLCGD